MISTAIDQKVRKGFSNAALRYEGLTDLHQQIGGRLTEKIEGLTGIRSLLDIGMGTGWFTHRLTTIFPDAMVVGLDFAPGMVSCARKKEGTYKIVEADAACLPFKDGAFDMIVSNLAYQWVENLPQAFTLAHSRLNKKGSLYLTMFGRHTFDELFIAIDACAGKKKEEKDSVIQRLAGKTQVSQALESAGFSDVRVETERIKVYFDDMMNLIKWTKSIGANALARDVYVGKDLLLKANEYYNRSFKGSSGVYATCEVIWVEARG